MSVPVWVCLSHRQGSGERRFVSFSSSSPVLLPTHFPVPLQYSSFSCCCENVCTREWSEHVRMEEAAGVWGLNLGIPRGVAEFVFCVPSALLRDVP